MTGDVAGIEAVELVKSYGHVRALNGASIVLPPGEVVAVFGDNGAGKSTFLKSLCGVVVPDSGTVKVDGEEVTLGSVRDAHALGIDVVFQDLALAPHLSVAENVFLGHELYRRRYPRRLAVLDRHRMGELANETLHRLGIDLQDASVAVQDLSGGQRQAVAVARATMWATRAVFFDEPTAALGTTQSDIVMRLVRQVAARGLCVLVISHDIPRMLKNADRVVVMRHGQVVATAPARAMDVADVVMHMVSGGDEVARDAEAQA